MTNATDGDQEGFIGPMMPMFLRAQAEDFENVKYDIAGHDRKPASYSQLSQSYLEKLNELMAGSASTADINVFSMLAALSSMYLRESEPNQPFGSRTTYVRGRSAEGADFHGKEKVLQFIADHSGHSLLRARSADLVWLLNRRLGKYAVLAIQLYCKAVEEVRDGEITPEHAAELGSLHPDCIKYVGRALQIAKGIRKQRPDLSALHNLASELFSLASERGFAVGLLRLGEMCLYNKIIDAPQIAEAIETHIADGSPSQDVHGTVELWKLAASCYHVAEDNAGKQRCEVAAGEALVQHALSITHSALLRASFLSDAIKQFDGIPGTKDRKNELRRLLTDTQSHISDELTTYSQEIDLTEIAEATIEQFSSLSLIDQLFTFSGLDRAPDPASLVENARKSIGEHPLSSMFSSLILDREFKVVKIAEGATVSSEAGSGAVEHKIAQDESFRRHLVVRGRIEIARQVISARHLIEAKTLAPLLSHSAFVPPELRLTFSHGVAKYFQGDFISAYYILVPLLEAGIKRVLKLKGVDVMTVDAVNGTQEDRNISSIFSILKNELYSVFTPRIIDNLERVFLSKFGPYVRHSVAHGLGTDGDPFGADAMYACFLIFQLAIIPLLSVQELLKEELKYSMS